MLVSYIGHTKFSDWMALWITWTREPNCKYGEIAVAIQAHRFVEYLKYFHNSTTILSIPNGANNIFSKNLKNI